MSGKRGRIVLGAALALLGAAVWLVADDRLPSQQQRRETLQKTYNAGNYRDAYDGLRKLALDPSDDPMQVGKDLELAVTCLRHLGRTNEVDDFREAVIAVHKNNWRLLETAARNYATPSIEHYGFIVAGKFYRGHHRGGGRYVSTQQRDRVRALQLMQQALPLTAKETDRPALASFHLEFANLLLSGSGFHEPWRLQYLTDLSQLPDYEEGYRWYGGDNRGAPVDVEGKPVFHHVPKSYQDSQTDGERWRWMLTQAVEFNPARTSEVDIIFANFLRSQFGVQTMANYGFPQRGGRRAVQAAPVKGKASGDGDESGTYALHTLGDDETIARLANGIKRFKLPDEFNWIKIYERVAARGKSQYGQQARDTLAQIYEDRRQYVKAEAAWKKAIEEYGVGDHNFRQERLDQIVGNWGRFEPGEMQPAGKKAFVDFRYRNGHKVSFTAHAIKVEKLLDDVKNYIQSKPAQLDWNQLNIGNIGYRLVEQNQQQYVGEQVASWDVELTPRPNHVDDRITVTTPMSKPGAYLLVGRMADGNTSRIIVWLTDTVILKKNLDGRAYYYVADADTGTPVEKARLDFFGYRATWTPPNKMNIETTAFKDTTDDDGQFIAGPGKQPAQFQWLITARKAKAGQQESDRFAYLGFTGVWYNAIHDPEYKATRIFVMSDRPVYRPDQKVQFKAWIRHAQYDQKDTSDFADQTFTVTIHNPKGEKVYEKALTTDSYGGLSGELTLPKDTTLGVYNLGINDPPRNRVGGHLSFRVEEYKKPEFEVTIEAPKEPVRLGETVSATIKARYYFGAPVTKAKVKYKVLRTSHDSRWYPRGNWDWFYGAGYWWFAGDYAWYPGWNQWGCRRPSPWWWGQPHEQPEVVLESEAPIGPDGTVQVQIDTAPTLALHPDQDHQFSITAEVVDESRRTIVGTGNVLASRKPFQVFAWLNHGHYRTGQVIKAGFSALTLDRKPVEGTGELTLFKITYDKGEPVEKAVQTWKLDTDVEGKASQQLKAAEPGQYRLSYKVTDSKKHTIEGAYLFVVRGEGFDGSGFRFNDVELVTDKREYAPGEKVKLLVNTNQENGTVLLFVRPTNGVYLQPRVLRLSGKSVEQEVAVVQKDMPNFFVEAVTVHGGHVYAETREVVVPPEKRVLNVEVMPSQKEYRPGQKATVQVKLTDFFGKPFVGSLALSIYDRSVEYISGGTNVPEIREFFWKWRRHHYPQTESSLGHYLGNLLRNNERGMGDLGVFGGSVVEELRQAKGDAKKAPAEKQGAAAAPGADAFGMGGAGNARRGALAAGKEADGAAGDKANEQLQRQLERAEERSPNQQPAQEPAVRKNFADTALWVASLTTNQAGIAEVSLNMPENLTGWKIKAWGMGHGTKVGQGEVEVVTRKDLIVRMQAPRFFVEKDEVVLSANVHNYLKSEKLVKVSLELEGKTLTPLNDLVQQASIPAGGEKRVDWRVKVTAEGEAVVRMKAVTDEESDAMQMRFPCYVHGMLKMDSFAGVVRPNKESASVELTVPAERRVNDTRLEVRYSPTLAGAMVDALPYMVEYPYGCTEQTLNRFLPTVITQQTLKRMNLNLQLIKEKRTNLNAQEIGDDKERAKGWKRFDRNPVFDEEEVKKMSAAGLQALLNMQCSDGGWGWFSGWGEHSWPHTTAVVVHGLQLAKANGAAVPPGVIERGVAWLQNYQATQVQMLRNAPSKTKPYKENTDNVDALVYMVLADAGIFNADMRELLYRDRTHLAVYAKAMFGLALHREKGQAEKLAMILKNIDQFVVQDDENQTAYLRLPADNPWWYWYGSETEAHAYYLKLLSATSPKDEKASRLVKYLLNNRRHATYWNSTRDTAICIEALADYIKASGEDNPDLTVELWLDGKKFKEVHIDSTNLFVFDNKLVLEGDAVTTGKHVLEVRKKGTGPVYFNAYLTNFTLEDFIKRAGLEVKVNRKYYKLTKVDKKIKVPGSRGQPADQKVEKYERSELANLAELKSGDLVEVELEIDSKNDYEYILFEDPKAAGFEPMLVRSGYNPNDLGAYMELRDDRVCFFVRQLMRGKHSVSYRLRAEIPGKFSALPARASAMYAPELKGNSDEIKLLIAD
jgi:uncharacterized protein YfaS (alpha-2-macroglobulin family)